MIYAVKRLFSEEFNNLLFMNLLTALLCLPVITIGPALMALNGTLIKILDDRCPVNVIREYWKTFQDKFLVGVIYEVLLAAYVFVLLWAQSIGVALGSNGNFVILLTAIVGFLAAMVSVTTMQIAAGVRQPFSHSLWNGILLALGCFPRTLLSTLCVYGMLALGYALYPISLIPAIVIMISTTAVLSIGCLWPAYKSNVLDNCD